MKTASKIETASKFETTLKINTASNMKITSYKNPKKKKENKLKDLDIY